MLPPLRRLIKSLLDEGELEGAAEIREIAIRPVEVRLDGFVESLGLKSRGR